MAIEEISFKGSLTERLNSIIKANKLNCWVLERSVDTFKLCDLECFSKSSTEHYTSKEFHCSVEGMFAAIRVLDMEIAFHRGVAYCIREKLNVCANCESFKEYEMDGVNCSIRRSSSCRQATGNKDDETYWTPVKRDVEDIPF